MTQAPFSFLAPEICEYAYALGHSGSSLSTSNTQYRVELQRVLAIANERHFVQWQFDLIAIHRNATRTRLAFIMTLQISTTIIPPSAAGMRNCDEVPNDQKGTHGFKLRLGMHAAQHRKGVCLRFEEKFIPETLELSNWLVISLAPGPGCRLVYSRI